MPRIRFSDLPRGVWQHLLQRVAERHISLADLSRLQDWVKSEPQAPEGDWYKDFGSFKLCGWGEYPRTVLTARLRRKQDEAPLSGGICLPTCPAPRRRPA